MSGAASASINSIDKDSEKYPLEVAVSEDRLHETEVGYDIYKETARHGLEWTKKEERSILRRIDFWIMPFFCTTQCLAFVDKTALNYGNLFGMQA